MASSTGITCCSCQTKGTTSAAKTWCLECCKSLCEKCEERHDSSNASINHKTIPVEEYIKRPSYSILTIHCEKHNIQYEYFCPNHQIVLCKKCINSTHKSCKDIISLHTVTQNSKSSGVLKNMKTNIDDIQLTLQKIRQNRNDNLICVRTQIKDIQNKISRFRSQLNKTLDKMEKDLMEDLEKIENKTKSHIAILFKDLQEHEHKIEEVKRGIEGLEKYGTDLHTFLAGNQVGNIVHQEEEYIQSLFDQKQLENIIIKYEANIDLKRFFGDNENFGYISIATAPSVIPGVNMRNVRESQLPVRSHFSQLSVAQRYHVKTTQSETCNVTAVCMLPNKEIIFIGRIKRAVADYIHLLLVHNSDGLLKYSLQLKNVCSPNVIIPVDDRTVIINDHGVSQQIHVIDILKKTTIRTLNIDGSCIGIALVNDSLFCTIYSEGLNKVDLIDPDSMTQFYYTSNKGMSYVTTFGNKICYTDSYTNVVVLLNASSSVLWKYQDKALLDSPMKATFDKRGNIYVVGGSTYNVVFISHDGKQSRQVLSKEDGIMHTMSIDFDLKRNRLIVVSQLGDVVVYNCS